MNHALVVDDCKLNLDLLASFLKIIGMQVSCATSGEEALGMLRDKSFSVIITDYNMRGMSGIELARVARTVAPETSVILCTGAATQDVIQQAREIGVMEVLEKPLDYNKLAALLNEVTAAARQL